MKLLVRQSPLMFVDPSLMNIGLSFLFFRVFDIVKKGPVGWADRNIKGATGIMMDDIVAGVLAALVVYSINLLLKLIESLLVSKILIISGLFLILAGLFWHFGERFGIGKLPGDISFKSKDLKVYLPITTSILISILLSAFFWLVDYFRK